MSWRDTLEADSISEVPSHNSHNSHKSPAKGTCPAAKGNCANTANIANRKPEKTLPAGRTRPLALTDRDRTAIRGWLAHTGEADPAIIDDALARCEADPEARSYFLRRAAEVPQSEPYDAAQAVREAVEERDTILEFEAALPRWRVAEVIEAAEAFYRHIFGPGQESGCCRASVGIYCDEGQRLREEYYARCQ